MFSALDVSTSALVAQRMRLNAVAGNLANMSTTHNEAGEATPQDFADVGPPVAAERPQGPWARAFVPLDAMLPGLTTRHADWCALVQVGNIICICMASMNYLAELAECEITTPRPSQRGYARALAFADRPWSWCTAMTTRAPLLETTQRRMHTQQLSTPRAEARCGPTPS